MQESKPAAHVDLALLDKLTDEKRLVDLSVALLKFQVLPLKEIEVDLLAEHAQRQTLLVAPRGKVLLMPNGRRVFDPGHLMELEEYVRNGLVPSTTVRSDAVWALLVGLLGIFGLFGGWLPGWIAKHRNKARVKRWIDETGNTVYVAKDPSGLMVHLLAFRGDRRRMTLFQPLTNTLLKTGHYVLRLTYPTSLTSWHAALGVEMDPQIEVILDPTHAS